jgi:hypothetical protein
LAIGKTQLDRPAALVGVGNRWAGAKAAQIYRKTGKPMNLIGFGQIANNYRASLASTAPTSMRFSASSKYSIFILSGSSQSNFFVFGFKTRFTWSSKYFLVQDVLGNETRFANENRLVPNENKRLGV